MCLLPDRPQERRGQLAAFAPEAEDTGDSRVRRSGSLTPVGFRLLPLWLEEQGPHRGPPLRPEHYRCPQLLPTTTTTASSGGPSLGWGDGATLPIPNFRLPGFLAFGVRELGSEPSLLAAPHLNPSSLQFCRLQDKGVNSAYPTQLF